MPSRSTQFFIQVGETESAPRRGVDSLLDTSRNGSTRLGEEWLHGKPPQHEQRLDQQQPQPQQLHDSRRVERQCGALFVLLMAIADTTTVLALLSSLCGGPLVSVLPLWMLICAEQGMGAGAKTLNALLLAVGVVGTVACSLNAVGGALAA